jgi:hypothetical protein
MDMCIYRLISHVCSNIQGNEGQPSIEQHGIETGECFARRKKKKKKTQRKTETLKMSAVPSYRKCPLQLIKTHFFAPLKDLLTENAETGSEGNSTKTPGTNETTGKGRPPPIVLTSEANLISLQRELKSVVSGEFFFRNTATGIRITTKSMVDYNTIINSLLRKISTSFQFTQSRIK